MLRLFGKKKGLEAKGYFLVITHDVKEKTTSYFLYNKGRNTFDKKKLITPGSIDKEYFFNSIDDMIKAVSGKKDFKRFLAGSNVIGLYYVESKVVETDKEFVIKFDDRRLFYVPSRMQLEISPITTDKKPSK